MASGITRRCVVIMGDEDQCDDYNDFKADIEDMSMGVIEIEDLEDVKNAIGGTEAEKLNRFLKLRHAVLLVCSEKLKDCLDNKRELNLNLDGSRVTLNGDVLSRSLALDNIRNKVVLITWNQDDNCVPNILQNVTRKVHGNAISKNFVNQVICTIRGIPTFV